MENVKLPKEIKEMLREEYIIEEKENRVSIKKRVSSIETVFEIVNLKDSLVVLTENDSIEVENVTIISNEGVPSLHIKTDDGRSLITS